jgi:hypothetical protein
MLNEIDDKTIYNIIIIVFIFIGLLYVFVDKKIPQSFLVLVVFFTLKLIFNYRKCTFSYIECKYRGVKREDGLLASLMDHIVDLRNTKYIKIIYILSVLFIIHMDLDEFKNLYLLLKNNNNF